MLEFKLSKFSKHSHIEIVSKITLDDVEIQDLQPEVFSLKNTSSSVSSGLILSLSEETIDKIKEAFFLPKKEVVISRFETLDIPSINRFFEIKRDLRVYKSISYQGRKTLLSRTSKFNEVNKLVIKEFNEQRNQIIEKALLDINNLLETFVLENNKMVENDIRRIVVNQNVKKEFFDNNMTEENKEIIRNNEDSIEKLENEIKELKAKQSLLENKNYTVKRELLSNSIKNSYEKPIADIVDSLDDEKPELDISDVFG